MSLHEAVDDIYSSADIQEQLQANRAATQDALTTRGRKVIRVDRVMNGRIAHLFGSMDDSSPSDEYLSQRLDNNSTTEN